MKIFIFFEPSQYNFKFLNENFKNNKHAVLFQLGLSDKKDTANLAMPLGKYNNWYNKLNNTGIMSIHGQGTFRKEKIEIDTFDNLKISKMLKSDNCFVKMDIEGHEYFALLGMTSLLKEDNVFQVEINFTFGSENNGKIFDLFKSNGFTAYLYIDETDSFKEINLSNLGTSEVSDVFFVKRGMLP